MKSLIGLRKYKEGYEFYLKHKDNTDIQSIIKTNYNNINELIKDIISKKDNKLGIFNYKKMLLEEKTNFYLSYGDYINEKISIDFDEIKGLKLICKSNIPIKRGELLIAEKALVSKKNNYKNNERKEEPWQNLEMTNELMEKIKKYKEDYKIFFILYNGKNKLLNLEERKTTYLNNAEKKIDFTEVKNIIDSSKYSASRNIFYENNLGVGLWGYTSIMNHSCNPNVNNFSIGDFMFCFAIRDISFGEELNTLYFSNTSHYLLRQEKSKINWNFNCSCEFCLYDNNKINDINKDYYENSMKEFFEFKDDKKNHENNRNKFIEFEKFLREKESVLTRYEIAKGYLKLIYHYGVLDVFNKCMELSEKMFARFENENFYSILLESLNYLFYFFGYEDKNIINSLIIKYEKLILTNTNIYKDDLETLVKLTLNYE